MVETIYDKINDYASVTIRLASPEDIRSWSFGEVKKPETINYRTYRSERDGLFCERIFGPEKDWECACGKYKGIKHKNIICDKCGVMITTSRERRKRMGHINLAAPVAHIWFFKAMPSRLATLLQGLNDKVKTSSLERVIYFQDYLVVEAGDTPLKRLQLLTEEEYRQARQKFGNSFQAGMGAEAVREVLKTMNLDEISENLREDLRQTDAKQRIKDIIKRLKTVEMLRDSGNRPEWMIMDVVPVIPPDLRPLVLLDSGNFATSDLNDLYRRLINRNNRLKKLLDLNAPEVIIRNEKRMLQQSVDALFDNGRCRRPVLGSSNRPLKSLTDMIKGKQGRFRENLLGKRVDYSARSVIVVGPDLRLHQCGLPKIIALELYQPFIIRRLKELGHVDTIKSAKKMLERKDEEVWDILEEVIQGHPVLLNRAPTLHRMGIQAFEPVLVEGNAIRIHPLVCAGYNADFDGDQMAVHLPLSFEAQIEASTLMLSINNIFSPAHGGPIIAPSQDIVLGCYFLTLQRPGENGEGKTFSSKDELWLAFSLDHVHIHAKIKLWMPAGVEVRDRDRTYETDGSTLVETTPGRVMLNDILPAGMPFYNYDLDKKALSNIIADCHIFVNRAATLALLDDLKKIGFLSATRAGLSFGKDDMLVPPLKQAIIDETQAEVEKITEANARGIITEGERYLKVIDAWTHARERIGEEMLSELRNDTRDGKPYVNPIFCMVMSKARGSVEQIRQLAGMRGLMAKPSGKIIETPIKANFKEGLRVLEYFSSTHGARKGLADTALKTADSGYLTRKLADVAQNVVITMHDCGTPNGIEKGVVYQGEKVAVNFVEAVRGRVSRQTIIDHITDEVIIEENEVISVEKAREIEQTITAESMLVRSPLTCEAPLGVCALCYGMDLSRAQLAEPGLAVGIIGAQSIGEPGTQLTMRTFHIGGTASKKVEESEIKTKRAGKVRYANLDFIARADGKRVVLKRKGEIIIVDQKDREIDRYPIQLGAILVVDEGAEVPAGAVLCSWDPHHNPILAEVGGIARFEDVLEGKTMRLEKDLDSKVARKVIIEHKGDLHPQVIIEDANGDRAAIHPLPEKAYIEVEDGQKIEAGMLLAKTPREIQGTQDITGGLPRVTELFEARRPKDPAVLSEIEGVVEIGEKRRGKRTIIVRGEGGAEREHMVPQGKNLRVHRGDRVVEGEPLVDGPRVPHDILAIQGEKAVQDYLLREVQSVYRAQGVSIDDKHIEIILAQMMRKVQVNDPGDSEFLPGAVVDKFRFRRVNEDMIKSRKKPATSSPLLLGITKASLQSESFISAASFQETTKVLTEAALAGKSDELVGLKENVILGHLVPTGTGFRDYLRTRVQKNVDLHAAAEEIGRLSKQGYVDVGGPVIRLDGEDDDLLVEIDTESVLDD
ncbi:MAG: DNA-directed RNA polymerase subunit beta' [Planctomycetota bacterium]|nr:DNA-directed RNA polymerase subunit beta' [Planctomycetota bacterium]MDA0932877.1 DNA-directed RNA polymerase subunit beta' [Planctomycetota bacterium]MDA1221585.1 DNA-directed RNA polymerase subunit beta' [Planctomycetota bacterium]